MTAAACAVGILGRISQSWTENWDLLDERVATGMQPTITLRFTSFEFLLYANIVYLLVTLSLYQYMKQRKEGLNDKLLKRIIFYYNAICVGLAGYVVYAMVNYKVTVDAGSFVCNTSAKPNTPETQYIAFVFWIFYAQKFWEFMDTWFFLLRRSFRQVTFLHIFHHSSITFVVGSILRFDYSGDMFLPIFLNACVHVLMYSHYLVTAMGIKSWWRQYLTTLQLLQFCAISMQSGLAWSRGPSCGSPDWSKVGMMCYMGSMLWLFARFFYHRYIKNDDRIGLEGVITTKAFDPQYASFHGTVELNESGCAQIVLPESAKSVMKRTPSKVNVMYLLTPVGARMPDLFVSREVFTKNTDATAEGIQEANSSASFAVAGGAANKKVCWQFTCEHVSKKVTSNNRPQLPCCKSAQ